MKLSIIIPCYNAESHIIKCLKSIVNQGFATNDYEIIVIDDGSTDYTVKVIEDFNKAYKNVLLFKQPNQGQGVARNKGIDLAKGDYIYFIDADDYLAYNSLNTIFQHAVPNKLDVIGFKTLITHDVDLFDLPESECINEITITTGIDFLLKNKSHRLEAWWYITRREYLIKSGFKFEEGTFLEDVIFTFKVLHGAKRFAFLPITIHRYFQNPNSTMQNETYPHLSKLIDGYLSLILRLDNLKKDISNNKTQKENNAIENIQYLSNSNTFYLFFKFTKSNFSIKKIDNILAQLIKIGAYPFNRELITKEYTHYKIKTAAYIFNNRILFYFLLYPIRLLYKMGLIKVY
ncbi:glycosyltransferase [Flavivirga sp. 57AJ16]|uniref:glycosyltransferase family 2 protein n=1 Tax=Flavivirga sp. 57AJ16 TaxID=3025307 RepID=UPI002366F0DA|nr:glycosyltransferase [Flavivirga sp. 57AJ16]MDD7887618.1 glycosyltransferase [Flavivirga sp. 57AJ16]